MRNARTAVSQYIPVVKDMPEDKLLLVGGLLRELAGIENRLTEQFPDDEDLRDFRKGVQTALHAFELDCVVRGLDFPKSEFDFSLIDLWPA